jgi:transposase-like protein
MDDDVGVGMGPSERVRHANEAGPAPERRRRVSARRKQEVVLRSLRGEDLELVSRDLGVTAAELSGWREAFLAGGEASLESRPTDARDAEIRRLRAEVDDLMRANRLLEAQIERLEVPSPFDPREVEAMSRQVSPSTNRAYGLQRVTRIWRVPRSTIYRRRRSEALERKKPGPLGAMSDDALVEEIRQLLQDGSSHGEGYRTLWARLRSKGIRTSRRRVLRLMGKHGLLAHQRAGRLQGRGIDEGRI